MQGINVKHLYKRHPTPMGIRNSVRLSLHGGTLPSACFRLFQLCFGFSRVIMVEQALVSIERASLTQTLQTRRLIVIFR